MLIMLHLQGVQKMKDKLVQGLLQKYKSSIMCNLYNGSIKQYTQSKIIIMEALKNLLNGHFNEDDNLQSEYQIEQRTSQQVEKKIKTKKEPKEDLLEKLKLENSEDLPINQDVFKKFIRDAESAISLSCAVESRADQVGRTVRAYANKMKEDFRHMITQVHQQLNSFKSVNLGDGGKKEVRTKQLGAYITSKIPEIVKLRGYLEEFDKCVHQILEIKRKSTFNFKIFSEEDSKKIYRPPDIGSYIVQFKSQKISKYKIEADHKIICVADNFLITTLQTDLYFYDHDFQLMNKFSQDDFQTEVHDAGYHQFLIGNQLFSYDAQNKNISTVYHLKIDYPLFSAILVNENNLLISIQKSGKIYLYRKNALLNKFEHQYTQYLDNKDPWPRNNGAKLLLCPNSKDILALFDRKIYKFRLSIFDKVSERPYRVFTQMLKIEKAKFLSDQHLCILSENYEVRVLNIYNGEVLSDYHRGPPSIIVHPLFHFSKLPILFQESQSMLKAVSIRSGHVQKCPIIGGVIEMHQSANKDIFFLRADGRLVKLIF